MSCPSYIPLQLVPSSLIFCPALATSASLVLTSFGPLHWTWWNLCPFPCCHRISEFCFLFFLQLCFLSFPFLSVISSKETQLKEKNPTFSEFFQSSHKSFYRVSLISTGINFCKLWCMSLHLMACHGFWWFPLCWIFFFPLPFRKGNKISQNRNENLISTLESRYDQMKCIWKKPKNLEHWEIYGLQKSDCHYVRCSAKDQNLPKLISQMVWK